MIKSTDLLIVGGGAAGLLAAGVAARRGLSVRVLEKMERPGRKLMITGKGRCNLTNDCGCDEFLAAVRANPKFLYSAAEALSPHDTMAFFESLGVPLKTERGGRVFPKSDRAVDVVDALVSHAKREGALLEQKTVKKLLIEEAGNSAAENEMFTALQGVVTDSGEKINASKVLVATGGVSYPRTGSTGDGYALAQQAGHTVIPPHASLVPIVTQEDWCREAMGLSLRNVRLSLFKDGRKKPVFTEQGEMLFTHFGVSGPLVLSASAHMRGSVSDYTLAIDLKPALTQEQLDARILRDFGQYANRDFANALGDLLPRALIPAVVRLSGINPQTKVHYVTKEARKKLGQLLKALPLTPAALRPIEEAVITAGGVSVREVDPRTMCSRLLPGLYFAGEVLDLDAYTGGYNLQIAFSTAYLAAQSMKA